MYPKVGGVSPSSEATPGAPKHLDHSSLAGAPAIGFQTTGGNVNAYSHIEKPARVNVYDTIDKSPKKERFSLHGDAPPPSIKPPLGGMDPASNMSPDGAGVGLGNSVVTDGPYMRVITPPPPRAAEVMKSPRKGMMRTRSQDGECTPPAGSARNGTQTGKVAGMKFMGSDFDWLDDPKMNLAHAVKSGLLTIDFSKHLICDLNLLLPGNWLEGPGRRNPNLDLNSRSLHSIRCLVDSGSQTSALGRTAVDRLDLWSTVDRSFARKIGGVGGASGGGHGRLHYFRVDIQGEIFEIALEVIDLPVYETAFECILGLDFLAKHKGKIDLPGMQLELVSKTRSLTISLQMLSDH